MVETILKIGDHEWNLGAFDLVTNPHGLDDGGHKRTPAGNNYKNFLQIFADAIAESTKSVSTTSTSSLMIGLGSKTFTMEVVKPVQLDMDYKLTDQAISSNWMLGTITAIDGADVTLNVTRTSGGGMGTAWRGNLSGVEGLQPPLSNIHAGKILPPTSTDDITAGYGIGDVWVDEEAEEFYRCADNTEAAAVWVLTSLTADDLGALAFKNLYDDSITHQIKGKITEDLEVILVGDLAQDITITGSRVKLGSESATVTFKKDNVAIDGTVHSATGVATTGTHNQLCTTGNILTAVFTNVSATAPVDCFITLFITRG